MKQTNLFSPLGLADIIQEFWVVVFVDVISLKNVLDCLFQCLLFLKKVFIFVYDSITTVLFKIGFDF